MVRGIGQGNEDSVVNEQQGVLLEASFELLNAQEREAQLRQRLADAQAEAADGQRSRTIRDGLIAGLGLLCAGLFFWRRR